MSSAVGSEQERPLLALRDAERRAGRIRLTRLEQALEWAANLVPSPLRVTTSCCGMALAEGGDAFEALGSAPPSSSPRSADLLIVAGSLGRRQVPLLLDAYERLLPPRWVLAWGVCAISGGPYDNYATVSGLSRILPVDLHVAGCPPEPSALRAALERLRDGSARAARDRAGAEGWKAAPPRERLDGRAGGPT